MYVFKLLSLRMRLVKFTTFMLNTYVHLFHLFQCLPIIIKPLGNRRITFLKYQLNTIFFLKGASFDLSEQDF